MPLGPEPDRLLGPDAALRERPSDRVGPPCKCAVGNDRVALTKRDRVRGPGDLLGEERVDRFARTARGLRRPAPAREGFGRGFVQQSEVRESKIDRARKPLEEVAEERHEAFDRAPLEEIRPVFQLTGQRLRRLAHREGPIELRRSALERQWAPFEPSDLDRLEGRVLEGEEHLEGRRVARAARHLERLQDLLEGRARMFEGRQGHRPHALQDLGEGGIAVEVDPKDEGVHEEPDQGFDVGMIPVRDRRADRQVRLPGHAVERRGEGREQRHEEGRALTPGERLQRVAGLARERESNRVALARRFDRGREIRREREARGQTGEVSPPVVDVAGNVGVSRPGGVVRVLDRQRRERGGVPLRAEFVVQRRDFAHEDPDRPPVDEDVMTVEDENVPRVRERQDRHPPERRIGQVEGLARGADHPVPKRRLPGFVRLAFDERPPDAHGRRGREDRHELPAALLEVGAQHLVPIDHGLHREIERGEVDLPVDRDRRGDPVERALGRELREEPLATLRVGDGSEPLRSLRSRNRRLRIDPDVQGLDRVGEIVEARVLEENAQGNLGSEELGEARDQTGRRQRVTAQLEEVVVGVDLRDVEQLAEDAGDQLRPRRALAGRGQTLGGRADLRRAIRLAEEGPPVDLSIRREREGIHREEARGHHVVWQAFAQVPPKGGRVEAFGGAKERDQART